MNNLFYHDLSLIQQDESQWKAYNSKESTVVIAGPGSGKTRVLTLKSISIINKDLDRSSGLACLSYSRETVRELKKRLYQYGYSLRKQDYIGTVHGFCLAEIIMPFQYLYPEYNIPSPLKIAPSKLRRQIYLGVLSDLDRLESQISDTSLERERYLAITGSSQVSMISDPLASKAAEMYEERLSKSGYFDFTQIAKMATLMIQEKEYIRTTLEAKYPWLLIDEYQDLGKALHEMVLTLKALTDIRIFAVGDMDQSIYGFQGAYPDFLKEIYESDDFNSVQLQYNYRSNQDVISASIVTLNPLPPIPNYKAKMRNNEQAEFTFLACNSEIESQYTCVVEKVIPKLLTQNIPLHEIAIITGSNSEASDLALVLRDKNIPCYISKWSFEHNSEVLQWITDCANWIVDPISNSFDRIYSYWKYLLRIHNDQRSIEENIKIRIDFLKVLEIYSTNWPLKNWIISFIENLQLLELLDSSERFPEEKENIKKLVEEISEGSLKDFSILKFIKIKHPENEVTITTRHSAKGLEFEAIIMIGMEEGRFPYYNYKNDSREMQEAHRLCYVCISRAKKICVLLYSKYMTRISKDGKPYGMKYSPSRFWVALHSQFGSRENTYDANAY